MRQRVHHLAETFGGLPAADGSGLQPLYEDARSLVKQIGRVKFEHVRRELNKDADRLANEAMDEAAASRRSS